MEVKNKSKINQGLETTHIKKSGAPLYIGEKGMIPIIEIIISSKSKENDKSLTAINLMGFNVEATAFIVVEGNEEWILPVRTSNTDFQYYLDEVQELRNKLQEVRARVFEIRLK